jgi:serine protease AprX
MAGMFRSAIRPLLALALMFSLLGAEVATAKPARRVLVVVGAQPGRTADASHLVTRLGGRVERRLAIVHGFTARVPAAAIPRLRRAAAIRTVVRDTKLTLSSTRTPDYDFEEQVEPPASDSGAGALATDSGTETAATGAGADAPTSDSGADGSATDSGADGTATDSGASGTDSGGDTGDAAAASDGEPGAHTIDLPPDEIPTGLPADEVARDVIGDAAEDAAAGSSLEPDPVASGEDTVPALSDAVTDPTAPIEPVADDGPARARASLDLIRAASGADGSELTGAGVDVALIDSGVLGVAALDGPGKLVRGPDFSEDAYDPDLRGLDAFGHGSHMAGVIAGNDPETGYQGIAPGARLVSVKVAGADGVTSLVRVLMALDWVRRNRNSNGLHIRVLNLSFGVDQRRSYVREPLAYAAEQLWNRGVAVVAAAGNRADGTGSLDLPAADPFLIAVGATDTGYTGDAADDSVADFSSRDAVRPPDVVAPGTGVISLRVPGSTLDEEFSAARIGEGFFRGNGTSQAAAVVSGLVARLLEARPALTPDQVKALLKAGAVDLPDDVSADGAGRVDLARTLALPTPAHAAQPFEPAVLDLHNLWADLLDEAMGRSPAVGTGENGWTGRSWSGRSWSGRSWSGRSWSSNDWSAADAG